MARPVRLTKKQKNIMGLILAKAADLKFLTVKELHKEVSHGDQCSYGAIRKSLDVLEEAGMIVRERRSGENSKQVKPTHKGYDWFRPLRT